MTSWGECRAGGGGVVKGGGANWGFMRISTGFDAIERRARIVCERALLGTSKVGWDSSLVAINKHGLHLL